ncbi:single-stranded-DNA-specific exonuclease RecJ [Paenibacillus glycanilyticus]|uniref:single-stranded-DNA-specific exonuclease RecJ n=1 Tax=Paenibacillus glycanilyticus TaxID=126569 RepID=UPI000FDB2033|nr:single-stranded-DNA-specific exonuclease RecJ [Paenibacillus glycanilyticus]
MIQAKTRWNLAPWNNEDEQQAERLSAQLGIPPLVAKLLVQRGYKDKEAAETFLRGGEDRLHDPYLLKDMKEAVDRIRQAADNSEFIRIYGDYDADGVSSTSLLIHVFRELGYSFDYYIPHRALEGYGLNTGAIDLAAADGVRLIVTVDTGISAYEQVEYAKSLGIDIVVTDHHEPPERIPDAVAVVNPKREDCPYPFKGLAGVGVAFKLATALMGRPPMEWTDIVSLGTIADIMPLTDENRVLVRAGLARLQNTGNTGFRALSEACGIELDQVTSTTVAFGMAPRINAAGRLDHAKRAVELLTTGDYDEAIRAASSLDVLNKERQRIVDGIVKEAEQQWQGKRDAAQAAARPEPAVIVLAGEGWNVGVIGIVASKILERYYKPVIILGIDPDNGMCKGSARSIEGYDLHAALTECDELLDHYGGHQAAAGMSLHRDQLPAFEEKLGELAMEWMTEQDWIPKTAIDLVCSVGDASIHTIGQLALLEPFGAGNPSPRLLLQSAELSDYRTMGKDARHLKLSLRSGRASLDAVGFGLGELSNQLQAGLPVDLVGELSINEWNGQRKAQLHIHDLYFGGALARFPEREHFGQVYQLLRRKQRIPAKGIEAYLSGQCGWPEQMITVMLEVFLELGFIAVDGTHFVVAEAPQKRDLGTSQRYQEAKREAERLRSPYVPNEVMA